MSEPEDRTPESEQAEEILGYYDKETVLYDRFEPGVESLPVVNFAYVPIVPNRMQDLLHQMEQSSRAKAMRLSVQILSKQLRVWDLRKSKTEVADCNDARDIGEHVDSNLVEGICARIMDSRTTREAEESLRNFPGL